MILPLALLGCAPSGGSSSPPTTPSAREALALTCGIPLDGEGNRTVRFVPDSGTEWAALSVTSGTVAVDPERDDPEDYFRGSAFPKNEVYGPEPTLLEVHERGNPGWTLVAECSAGPHLEELPFILAQSVAIDLDLARTSGPVEVEALSPLPPGLSLSPAGRLQGTPTEAGKQEFRTRATAPDGRTAEWTLRSVFRPMTPARCGETIAISTAGDHAYSVAPTPGTDGIEFRFSGEGVGLFGSSGPDYDARAERGDGELHLKVALKEGDPIGVELTGTGTLLIECLSEPSKPAKLPTPTE